MAFAKIPWASPTLSSHLGLLHTWEAAQTSKRRTEMKGERTQKQRGRGEEIVGGGKHGWRAERAT